MNNEHFKRKDAACLFQSNSVEYTIASTVNTSIFYCLTNCILTVIHKQKEATQHSIAVQNR